MKEEEEEQQSRESHPWRGGRTSQCIITVSPPHGTAQEKHVKKTRHPSDHDALLCHFPSFFLSPFVQHFFPPLYTIHHNTESIHTIVFQLLFGLRNRKREREAMVLNRFVVFFMASVIRFFTLKFARARFRLAQTGRNFGTLLAILVAIEPVSREHWMYTYFQVSIQIWVPTSFLFSIHRSIPTHNFGGKSIFSSFLSSSIV